MSKRNYDLELTGFVGDCDFDHKSVLDFLRENPDREVSVLIDSIGGLISTGLTISAAFKNHGNVTVYLTGLNASAATVASMGAKRIVMDKNAMYLVHKSSIYFWEWGSKNADDLQKLVDECSKSVTDLDKIDRNIASMYASRCCRSVDDLLSLMKTGAWLSAEEAKEWGFVDEVEEDSDSPEPQVTDALAVALCAAGIPVPGVRHATASKSNGLERMLAAISEYFNRTKKTKHSTQNMDKEFTRINAALGEPGLVMSDNAASLPKAHLDKIEAALEQAADFRQQAEQDKAKLEQEIKALKAKLENTPAEHTTTVTDDGSASSHGQSDPFTDFMNTSAEAKKLFNSIP